MNELMELERELGPQLRRALDTIIPTDDSRFTERSSADVMPDTREDVATVTVGIEDSWATATGHRLRMVGVAAALVVVVGLIGIVTLSDRDRPPTTGISPATTRSEVVESTTAPGPAEPTAPSDPTLASTIPLPDPANPPGVYLPTAQLPGFTLADISVGRAQLRPIGRNALRYVRHGADGVSVVAMITLTGSRTTAVDSFGGKTPPLVVHGQPAHIFDSGEGVVSSWQENGVDASVRGWGVAWNDVASLAEQTVVDPATFTVALPAQALEGFELSIGDTYPPADAVGTDLYFVADDPQPGAFVSVTNAANDDLMTLDSIEVGFRVAGWTIDRAVVHQLQAIVATSIAGEFSPIIMVSWIEDGYQMSVGGRAGKDDLIAFAEAVAPATLEQARQLRAALDTSRFALPEVDRATLPNGFDVSIRTNGTGANVICLHAPIQRCQLLVSEGSLVGDVQHTATGTFWINETPWFIGWASGTHSPHLVVDGVPGDLIANVTQGGDGTFFAVPGGDTSTQVVFDAGDSTMYGPPGSGTNTDLLS
jgi:hypothetical protein